jgi:phosphate transport system substrate-binding protein
MVAVGAALALLIYSSPAFFNTEDRSPPLPRLKTGGTSSVFLLMDNGWRTAYGREKGVEVDYHSTGSTKGVAEMVSGESAIAFTHAPVTDTEKQQAREKGGEIVQVPVVLCAAVPIYNLKGLQDRPPLKFTGEVLADIYLGKVQKWDDPALKALNEGVDLPDTPITVVHREDSSGTTLIFTDFLHGASEAWRQKVGPASSEVKWPAGVGMPRNHGVANHVYVTEGAIGYVDLAQALAWKLDYGAVQNKDRTGFIHASAENMTASVKAVLADIPDDLAFDLTNKAGKDSYPISGVIYAVCYRAQPAAEHQKVVDFLRWVTHEGQHIAKGGSYAPLPDELVARVDEKLKSIDVAR